METRNKVKSIFNYLLTLKGINEKIIKNIKEYHQVVWINDVADNNTDECITISKKSKKTYDYLFNLYEDMQKNNESYEIVYGSELFTWMVDGEKIIHPIFTKSVELDFNPLEDKFYLKTYSNNLEIQFLQGLDLDLKNIASSKKDYYNLILNYINERKINKNEESNYICGSKEYKIGSNPSIIQEPVIIVRKENMNLWKEDIKNIIKGIDRGMDIPKPLRALVEENLEENEDWMEEEKDILFPLLANEEQREVVRLLSKNFGVVVQGPPGTGKSHTIANLICHFLARGKRVLITSERGGALKVLKDKIPEEIRPLCISLLGNDSKEMQKLEESVRFITENLSTNPRVLYEDIFILEKDLSNCRTKMDNLFNELKKLEEREKEIINYHGQEYTLVTIAKWVKENEKEYSWIEDSIRIDSRSPISSDEFEKIKECMKKIEGGNLKELNNVINLIDEIPEYDELYGLIIRYKGLKDVYEKNINKLKNYNIYFDKGFNYNKAIECLNNSLNEFQKINNVGLGDILETYHSSYYMKDSILNLSLKWKGYIKRLNSIRKGLNNYSISLPKDVSLHNLKACHGKIYNELSKRGKISKLFSMIHKDCKYFLENCFIDGNPLENLEQSMLINLYIEEKTIENTMRSLWNNTFKNYNHLQIGEELHNALIELEQYMECVNIIINWNENIRLEVSNSLDNIKYPYNLNWYREDTFTHLKDCLNYIKEIYDLRELTVRLNLIKTMISNHKEFSSLLYALEELDINKLRKAYIQIEKLKGVKATLEDVDSILYSLREVLPKLYSKMINGNMENLNNWNRAWRWKKWSTMLEHLEEPNRDDLENHLENEKSKEREIIREIICKRAWYNQISKISEREKRSLFSWLQAVKRIGKGKGKYVGDYIRLAQEEIENCKDVVPVWIMPLNKVIENIDVTGKQFDVVIVDESSQSNIFALSALMRGKRAIVVGDDKQISPEGVGVDQENVNRLINLYLKDVPNKEWYDLQTSLYDTALRVFPSRILLKEHFRCVPEIIEFSNKLCYSGQIIPLRYAHKQGRLYPAINPIKIENGERDDKKGINVGEAEAIVEKIYNLCKDKAYRGMTMGVISLLGENQAQYIQERLRIKVGEEEIIKRRIICGDAYSFQGDERDVIFLSMVVAGNMKFASLTKESDVRRFNVAATRAKNQLWVYHSVEPETLNMDCVRFSLLNYCYNYSKAQMRKNNLQYVFYSDLQRDVHKILEDKGLEPLANVNIGEFKIDFVLESNQSKIAIICIDDLDEAYEAKSKLKTLGWKVLQVRDVSFYRRPEEFGKKVFSLLNPVALICEQDPKELKVV
ncbi:AAA domain-containing protein [Clostridium malenominatum]|uniref:AAA domain-containing protein n=1 Tax=Clostridium malenominatum TaxID=1539 RepID=A0ABP3UAH4_9CLOT